eukprot:scaffold121308_cov75-Phaeocystis_antarctica.AAC.3
MQPSITLVWCSGVSATLAGDGTPSRGCAHLTVGPGEYGAAKPLRLEARERTAVRAHSIRGAKTQQLPYLYSLGREGRKGTRRTLI